MITRILFTHFENIKRATWREHANVELELEPGHDWLEYKPAPGYADYTQEKTLLNHGYGGRPATHNVEHLVALRKPKKKAEHQALLQLGELCNIVAVIFDKYGHAQLVGIQPQHEPDSTLFYSDQMQTTQDGERLSEAPQIVLRCNSRNYSTFTTAFAAVA